MNPTFQTIEAYILNAIYVLYKMDLISLESKAEFKDLLIQKDPRMMIIGQSFASNMDVRDLHANLLNLIVDTSPQNLSCSSPMASYKTKRPSLFNLIHANQRTTMMILSKESTSNHKLRKRMKSHIPS